MAQINCPLCGKKVFDNDEFCSICCTPLKIDPTDTQPAKAAFVPAPRHPESIQQKHPVPQPRHASSQQHPAPQPRHVSGQQHPAPQPRPASSQQHPAPQPRPASSQQHPAQRTIPAPAQQHPVPVQPVAPNRRSKKWLYILLIIIGSLIFIGYLDSLGLLI